MDTATFLARVVAPGNYLALCYKGPGKPMGTRFFPRESIGEAVGFLQWADRKGMDVWYAPASYRLAEASGTDPLGNPVFKGKRTQENVDQLHCWWYDADIKREGDGKDPSRCFADMAAVEAWVNQLSAVMPEPNLWVCSGYGIHLYWIIDGSVPRTRWQLSADRIKSILADNGAKGDVGITTDAARILRPPNTRNYKVATHPVPVYVVKDTIDGAN